MPTCDERGCGEPAAWNCRDGRPRCTAHAIDRSPLTAIPVPPRPADPPPFDEGILAARCPPAPPPPPAEPPAEAVRSATHDVTLFDRSALSRAVIDEQVVVRGTLLQHPGLSTVTVIARGAGEVSSGSFLLEHVRAIRSLLPAGWPRYQLGQAKGPLLELRANMNSNECRRALSEAFGLIPEPKGGWRGRDAVIVGAIRGLCTMFAPYHDPDSSGWWEIQDALDAVAQMADEVEVTL